ARGLRTGDACRQRGEQDDRTEPAGGLAARGHHGLHRPPVPAGGPAASLWPSAQVTQRAAARLGSLRARQPNTVTVSPIFIVSSRFQPWRTSMLVGYPSNRHGVTLPSSPFTSSVKCTCGLAQSTFVALPGIAA